VYEIHTAGYMDHSQCYIWALIEVLFFGIRAWLAACILGALALSGRPALSSEL
jgi:hypothetical protein